jgi:outer membrane protein OmpA-like peptidoglycan-associated protein/tetratricopeptide (TPR) repeat protein
LRFIHNFIFDKPIFDMYSIRCVLIFLAVAGAFIQGFSQTPEQKQQALEYLAAAEDMKAASQADDDIRDIYILAAEADPTNIKANFEAGHYRLRTIGKDLAVQYFLRVYALDPNYVFDLEYYIGYSYQHGLQFDKAIEFYKKYIEKIRKRPNYQGKKTPLDVVERSIYECENGKVYIAHPHNYAITNLGPAINSEYDDYAPVLNESETEMIFTSRRRDGNSNQDVDEDNKPFEEIFISYKKDGKWTPAVNLEGVNSPYHESTAALSADGQTLFLYMDSNGGDFYTSELQPNGKWSSPKPLPGLINSTYSEVSISISRDEKIIYFSSNRPGGLGGMDIYTATQDANGQWSNIKNLGPDINTELDEDGPFIDHDGVTLYFSSKGRAGMGGYDIYRSAYNAATGKWSEPENIGYPINTPDNDIFIYLSADNKRGYYASVREDAIGYDDIYMINLVEMPPIASNDPEPVKEPDPVKEEPEPITEPVKPVEQPKKQIFPLKYVVSVVDRASRQPLDVSVKLQGARDNVVVGIVPKGVGVVEFNITNEGQKEYRLTVESEGYIFVNETVTLKGASEKEDVVNRTIEMRKLEVDVVHILRNLYFDFDKWTFKQESYNELNKLERMMLQNPNMKVEIRGHTDRVGTKNYNLFLSRKRAEAVKDFLTKKGIDSRRIKVIGFGYSKPLASNDDEKEGRELNRRVEFKVTEM